MIFNAQVTDSNPTGFNHVRNEQIFVPDWQIEQPIRRVAQDAAWQQKQQQPVEVHKHLSGLAKAGIAGIIIVGIIALVAGILAVLPRGLRAILGCALIGWLVYSCVTAPKDVSVPPATTFVGPATDHVVVQRALPVSTPVEVRRAALVNPHPKQH